jgi:undecaprenyl-diphosphatase
MLSPRRAVLLGLLHGPTELLPVSSSGHIALLAGDGDPELRKAFEVAVHAGTAAALLIALRSEVGEAVTGFDARRAILLVGSFIPPAVAGLVLERPIERRLGTPGTIAAGLAAGALAMVAADRAPRERSREDAGAADALALGLAQACALAPGVSRNGATLTAARARRFRRSDANALSRHVALPVIAGATVLKGERLRRRGIPPELRVPFALGAAAAFASTLSCARVIRLVERDRPLWPYAAYRLGLAAVVARRLRA